MPLVPASDIIVEAAEARKGIAAFNVSHIEHATAFMRAAEQSSAPLVLQISENTVRYHGDLQPLGAATFAMARGAAVPVATHLDHATDPVLIEDALQQGFTSVMFDGSTLDYAQNVAATAEVAAMCHERGAIIEAELGEIGGKDGVHNPSARTDPGEALRFVADTGVDTLAVAVGTSHAMTARQATLDIDLIRHLHEEVPIPLVLHGSSGVPDADLAKAVAAGITKINIATRFNIAFTDAVRAFLESHADVSDSRRYMSAGRSAIEDEARRLLAVLRSGATGE